MRIVGRNVDIDGGEIDLCALDSGVRVAVEVRTVSGGADPIDAIDREKRERVERLAIRMGAQRVDLIGIRLGDSGIDVHWVPGDGPIPARRAISSRR